MQPKIQKIQKKKYYKLKFRIVGKSDKTSTWEYELDTSVRFLHN